MIHHRVWTVYADRDANGSYETLEHEQRFTADSSGYAPQSESGDADGHVTYDKAGNPLYEGGIRLCYDARNRLVTVTTAWREGTDNAGGVDLGAIETGSVVATFVYDGMSRRITKAIDNSAYLDCTYAFFYDGQRVVETRNGCGQVIRHEVWGLLYVDELVKITLNGDPADDPEVDPDDADHDPRVRYALHNANFNVMMIIDASGGLV